MGGTTMASATVPIMGTAMARAAVPVMGTAMANTTVPVMSTAMTSATALASVPSCLDAAASAQHETPPLTPIQPVFFGSSEAALRAQRALFAAGFCVIAIRPPTVPQGSARLRVTLTAAHTEAQVDSLVEALSRVCAAREMA